MFAAEIEFSFNINRQYFIINNKYNRKEKELWIISDATIP